MPDIAPPGIGTPPGTPPEAARDSNPRSCGTCFACCVVLGITALRKYPGQTCKHLDGRNASKLCTIYESRPQACSGFECGWRLGFGSDFMRPDQCGVLVSLYGLGENDAAPPSATLTITDPELAGEWGDGQSVIQVMLRSLLDKGLDDVRIVRHDTGQVIHAHKGLIRQGHIIEDSPFANKHDPDRYEQLNFATFEPPIGRWERKEKQT